MTSKVSLLYIPKNEVPPENRSFSFALLFSLFYFHFILLRIMHTAMENGTCIMGYCTHPVSFICFAFGILAVLSAILVLRYPVHCVTCRSMLNQKASVSLATRFTCIRNAMRRHDREEFRISYTFHSLSLLISACCFALQPTKCSNSFLIKL